MQNQPVMPPPGMGLRHPERPLGEYAPLGARPRVWGEGSDYPLSAL